MSRHQLVFKMRRLLEDVEEKGIFSDFSGALKECVRLTNKVSTENDIDGYGFDIDGHISLCPYSLIHLPTYLSI